MAESELKHLWLHDENKTTTIAPKVVIDDIQMDDSESSELFKENYDDFKTDYAGYKTAVAGTVARIDGEIDNLKQTATPSSNGLMSKEDKIKLNGLHNYELGMASTTDLGGVRIDDETIAINENGVISTKKQNLNDLNDVLIGNPSDNDLLIYNNGKWRNSKTLNLSLELEQLTNVDIDNISSGDTIIYDSNNNQWKNGKINNNITGITINNIDNFFSTAYLPNNEYSQEKVLKEAGLHYTINKMKNSFVEEAHKPATSSYLGSIMVGNTLDITEEGVLNYNLPTASQNTLGGVKIDNSTIKIANGVISSSSEIDDEAGTSATDKTWSAAKITQAISAGAGGEGTLTSISAGVGLTTSDGDPITSSGTIKAKLKSETASALSSAAMGSTTDRQYAVGVDADGYLSVNVPWTDTQGGSSSYILPPATSSDLGGIKVGYNLNMDSTVHQGTLTADQFKISKYLAEGVEATNGKINLFEINKEYCRAIEQQGYVYVPAHYGINITINSDYSITINGTSTQNQYIPLGYYFDIKNNDKCFYTDNLEGETSLDTFVFGMRFWDEHLEDYNYIRPVRNLIESSSVYASEISNTTISEGYEISELYLIIKEGITVTDVTCYPMVLHKGYLGVTDYYPPKTFYTNRELYNKIVDFSNKINFLMQDCVSNNVYYSLPIGYLDPNLTVDSSPYTHTITLNGTIPSGSAFDSGEIDIGYIKMNHPFKHTLLILDGGYIPEYCELILSNSNHGSYTISYSDLNTYDAFDLMHEYDYDSQEYLDKIPYTYQNANIYEINRDWETENIGVSLRINKTSSSSYKEYDNDFFRIDVMVYDEGFDPNGYLNYQDGYKINVKLQNEVSELTSALLNLQSRVAELENNINSNNNT